MSEHLANCPRWAGDIGLDNCICEVAPKGRIAQLEAALAAALETIARLDRTSSEVSPLCAVCDQIKELHPNTHPWTARTTPETPPYLRGAIIQAHADTNGVPPQSETEPKPDQWVQDGKVFEEDADRCRHMAHKRYNLFGCTECTPEKPACKHDWYFNGAYVKTCRTCGAEDLDASYL